MAERIEERPRLAGPPLELLRTLHDELEAYRPVRPQAASRDEEIQRSEARRQCEDGILRLVAGWDELKAQPDPDAEPAPEPGDPGGAQTVDDRAGTVDEDQHAALDSLKVEHGWLQQEMGSTTAMTSAVVTWSTRLSADARVRRTRGGSPTCSTDFPPSLHAPLCIATTFSAASSNDAKPSARLLAASGSPPERASLRLASANSRARPARRGRSYRGRARGTGPG